MINLTKTVNTDCRIKVKEYKSNTWLSGHRTQDTGHRTPKVITELRRWWMYFELWIHPVVLEDQSVEDDLSNWEYSYSVISVSLVKTFSFCTFSFFSSYSHDSSSSSHSSTSSSSSYYYYYSCHSSSSSHLFCSRSASPSSSTLVFTSAFASSSTLAWTILPQLVLWLRFLFNILLHLLVPLWS